MKKRILKLILVFEVILLIVSISIIIIKNNKITDSHIYNNIDKYKENIIENIADNQENEEITEQKKIENNITDNIVIESERKDTTIKKNKENVSRQKKEIINEIEEKPSENIIEKSMAPSQDNNIIEALKESEQIKNKKEEVIINDAPVNETIESFKYNKNMSELMVSIIEANESALMKEHGYIVVIDETIVERTNQFTYSEKRVKDKLEYKFGTIRVYSRDYYINDEYIWTECFII
ncbi:MAG: hypothetical protein Q4G09_00305 [Clostridia bacterium]|nr:hypothetical protein [Clostridia bacterium]